MRLVLASMFLLCCAKAQDVLLPAQNVNVVKNIDAETRLSEFRRSAERMKPAERAVALQRILESPDVDLGIADGNRIVPVRSVVHRMLRELDEAAQVAYRRIFGSRAAALLLQYERSRDLAHLEAIVANYPLTLQYAKALVILTGLALDQGRFHLAYDRLQELQKVKASDVDENWIRSRTELAASRSGRGQPATPAIFPDPDLASTKLVTVWKRNLRPRLPYYAWPHKYLSTIEDPFAHKKHGRMFCDDVRFGGDLLIHSLGVWDWALNPQTGLAVWRKARTEEYQDAIVRMAYRKLPLNTAPLFSGGLLFRNGAGTRMQLYRDRIFSVETNLMASVLQKAEDCGNYLACLDRRTGKRLWKVGRVKELPLPDLQDELIPIPEHKEIAVDGLNDDWSPAHARELMSRERHSTCLVSYADTGVQFFVTAQDRSPMTEGHRGGDVVQLTFSVKAGVHHDTFVCSVKTGGETADVEFRDHRASRRVNWADFPLTADAVMRRTPEGYTVELVVPWTCFGSTDFFQEPFNLYALVVDQAEPKASGKAGRTAYHRLAPQNFSWNQGRYIAEQHYGPPVGAEDRWLINGIRFLGLHRHGRHLLLPYHRAGKSGLAAVDAQSGRLFWRTDFANHLESNSGRLPRKNAVAVAQGTVYCVNGNGLITAQNLSDGRIRWIRGYLRTTGEGNWLKQDVKEMGTEALMPLAGWLENFVAVVGEHVLIFPADQAVILALDRHSGEARFQLAKEDLTYVLGVADGNVYLAGQHKLRCLEAATGKWKWTVALTNSQGKGLLVKSGILIPDKKNVLEVDRTDGSIRKRLSVDGYFSHPLTNLHCNGEDLYAVGAGELARLVDERRQVREVSSLSDAYLAVEHPADAAFRLIDAWSSGALQAKAQLVDDLCSRLQSVDTRLAELAKRLESEPGLKRIPRIQIEIIDLYRRAGEVELAIRRALDVALSDSYRLLEVKKEVGVPLLHSSRRIARDRLAWLAKDDAALCKRLVDERVKELLNADSGPAALMLGASIARDAVMRDRLRQAAAVGFENQALPELARRLRLEPKEYSQKVEIEGKLEVVGAFCQERTSSDGTVICDRENGKLLRYDYETGQTRWTFLLGKDSASTHTINSLAVGPLLIVPGSRRLHCVGVEKGASPWSINLQTIGLEPYGRWAMPSIQHPALKQDTIRAAFGFHGQRSPGVINVYTGEVEWCLSLSNPTAFMAISSTAMCVVMNRRDGAETAFLDPGSGRVTGRLRHPDFYPAKFELFPDALYMVAGVVHREVAGTSKSVIVDLVTKEVRYEAERPKQLAVFLPIPEAGLLVWQRRGKDLMHVEDIRTRNVSTFEFKKRKGVNWIRWWPTHNHRYLVGIGHKGVGSSSQLVVYDLKRRQMVSEFEISNGRNATGPFITRGTELFLSATMTAKEDRGEIALQLVDMISGKQKQEKLAMSVMPVSHEGSGNRAFLMVFPSGELIVRSQGNHVLLRDRSER